MNHLRPNRSKGKRSDKKYKAWIASLPCVVCQSWEDVCQNPGPHWQTWYGRTEVAHIGERGLGQKCPDRETIPLCGLEHHREGPASHHKLGKKFFEHHGLDPKQIISELNARYDREAV